MLGKLRSARSAQGSMLRRPSRLASGVAAAVLSVAVLPILAVDAQAVPLTDCAYGFAEASDTCVVPAGVSTMTITVIGGGGGGGQASAVVGGGGGGGGEITVCDTVAVTPGDTLTLTVGDGGTGGGLGSGTALAATSGADSKVVTSGVAGELCKGRGGKAGVAGVGGDSGNGKAGGTGAGNSAGGGGGSGSATDDICGAGANGSTDGDGSGGGGGCGQDLFETGASGGGGGGSLSGYGGIANITGSGGNGGGFFTNCVAVSDGQNAHSYGAGGGGGGGASGGGGECLGGTGFKGVVILNFDVTPLCDATLYSVSAACVVPDGVTSMFVLVVGAGGGGGHDSALVGGGGGGGGDVAVCQSVAVTPGETLTLSVGLGGSGGMLDQANVLAATDGGDSVLTSGTSVDLCTALGGKAGVAGTGGAAGNSKAGGSGDTVNGGGGGGGGAGDYPGATLPSCATDAELGGNGTKDGGYGGCGMFLPIGTVNGLGGGGGGGSLSGTGGLPNSGTGGTGAGAGDGCAPNGRDAVGPSGGGGGAGTLCAGGSGGAGFIGLQFDPPASTCVDGTGGYASDDTVTYPVDCAVPDGMTSVDILVVGGGGGGGGGFPAGGGGGGGEVKVCAGVPVAGGQALTLDVGQGGGGSFNDLVFNYSAVAGTLTQVSDGSGPLCEALGGKAGSDAGVGGDSGATKAGGQPWEPDGTEAGGGGGGASGTGGDGVEAAVCGGAGGDGQQVSALASPGLFSTVTDTYGGGGGGASSSAICAGGAGGSGGGGAGGSSVAIWGTQVSTAPGGGGGAGSTLFCAPGPALCGNGSSGFGGYIELRFSASPKTATTTSTQVSKTVLAQGETVSDVATVAPDATPPTAPTTDPVPAPTGTVTFYYCYDETVAPTSCDDTSGTLIKSESVTGSDPYTATLTDWTPADGAGFYLFNAVYSGDSNYDGSADDGTNEAFEATNLIATTIRLTCPADDDLVRDPDAGGGVVYNGYAQKPCKAYVYAGETKIGPATITYTSNTDVGTATASATYDGDATYAAASAQETTFEITPAANVVVKPVGGKWIVGAPVPSSLYTTSGFKGTDSWSTAGMTPPTCAVYSDVAHTTPVTLDTSTLPGTYYVFCKDAAVNGNYQGVSYYRDGTLTVVGLSVTSVTPVSGPIAGGTRVRIYGTGFLAGMTVTVGGVPCTSVTVNSYANQLYCVTGAHAAGTADVVVTTPAGSKTLTSGFTYLDPSVLAVTGISPKYGSVRGGTKVHIYGTGFTNPISVTIGGVACTRISASYVTSKGGKEVDCYTGRHAAGVVNVVVTTTAGTVTLVGGYRYR